ncbi:MAG: hydroxyacid dehydrogenase [Pseudomonadota bacterium]
MIVITEFMDQAPIDGLAQDFRVLNDPSLADAQEKIPALLSEATALIVRNRTQVTADLLAAAPNLKVVGRLGVGLDNIDLVACADRNVAVIPATGANNLSVAEYVISTAMQLLRGAYQSHGAMMAGSWPRQACAGREIFGKTLGLVGFGAIAQHTAGLARGLGMHVVASDPFLQDDHPAWSETERISLDDLLDTSDVVSLHTPLTEETRHLINAPRLSQMKSDAILINAARGGVVDEAALVDALKTDALGGAALDVFETEPLSAEAAQLFDGVPNLILTPHIAGVTEESNVRVSAMIADKVREVLTGG